MEIRTQLSLKLLLYCFRPNLTAGYSPAVLHKKLLREKLPEIRDPEIRRKIADAVR